MPDGHILNDEMFRAVQQAVRQHLNSFQPRPKKGRRVRPGGGGSSSGDGGGSWGTITTAATAGSPDVPSTTCKVTLGSDFGGADLEDVRNYSPDTAAVGKACRVSQHLDQWVLDWWSCKDV